MEEKKEEEKRKEDKKEENLALDMVSQNYQE